jgi:hypothetical protein
MYIEYITYNFSMTIGLHVCASWNIICLFIFEKNAIPIHKIFFLIC